MTSAAASPRSRSVRAGFVCAECGWTTAKWVGRCGECQTWGTVQERGSSTSAGPVTAARAVSTVAIPVTDVDATTAAARPTGVGEFDRVLGGGVVAGAVMLMAGEPGIGKSTLLLTVAAALAERGVRVLYVTGEESAAQVRLRAERIQALSEELFLASEVDLGAVLGQIEAVQPGVLIVDSVQTVASAEVEGAPGNVSQVREVAASLIAVAKERTMPTILVGHVTKDGGIAGPRVLEHLVDVVVQFEGDRHSRLRLVRAVKNRYGPTDEVGCFDMTETGMLELPDPSGLFLTARDLVVPGSCVTVTVDGRRPLVVEVQALLPESVGGTPRRATSGVDGSRVAMIMAVLERRAGLPVMKRDVYAASVGGARVHEPAADVAVAMALASATIDQPLPHRAIALGEVGLAGEIRPVSAVPRRLAEAARLGFTKALVPPKSCTPEEVPTGLSVLTASHISEAITIMMPPSEA